MKRKTSLSRNLGVISIIAGLISPIIGLICGIVGLSVKKDKNYYPNDVLINTIGIIISSINWLLGMILWL